MILTVILADTFASQMSIVHLNESRPYQKRSVKIQLTKEQWDKIKPLVVGKKGDKEVREEILECFLDYKVSVDDLNFDDS